VEKADAISPRLVRKSESFGCFCRRSSSTGHHEILY
jgi:hypothetical protein